MEKYVWFGRIGVFFDGQQLNVYTKSWVKFDYIIKKLLKHNFFLFEYMVRFKSNISSAYR